MKIEIAEYNPEWLNQFKLIKEELNVILGELNPRIEHIGSTSVPGLAAKPIIDILVGIERVSLLDETIKLMIRHNYIYYEIYNSDMPSRRLYIGLKDKNDINIFQSIYTNQDKIPHIKIHQHKLTHIHILGFETPEWKRHIAFRDYLREHAATNTHYEHLKKELSSRNWKDGNEYNSSKNDFIKTEEEKAILWYNEKQKLQLTKPKLH
jgi:GrpB-like predicted nucleotidyltransferase (UPF0157 family)